MRLSTVEPKTITGEGRRLDPIEPASLDPDDGSDAEDVERRLPQHHAVPTTEREEEVQKRAERGVEECAESIA